MPLGSLEQAGASRETDTRSEASAATVGALASAKDIVGAVVIGGDFQGLGVIRSLAEEGIPVFLLEYEWSIGRYSRYVKRRAMNPSFLSDDSSVQYLIDLAREHGLKGWVLFANNDETVKFLSIHREALSEWFRVPLPDWETVRKFYVKQNAYEIAEKESIPIPKMYRAEGLDDLLAQEIEYPVVLKPSFKENYYEKTHKKAIRAGTRDELIVEYRRMNEVIEPSQIVVQEMIEGGPANLYSYVTVFDGEAPVAGMSARRRRQHPMDFGHATTYAESVHVPELEPLATRLLRAMSYQGVAEVEFMRDERQGCYKFIEINGRIWGWHTLAKAAGVNIAYVLYQRALGREVERPYPVEGVKWVRFITDVPTVMKEFMKGRMKLSEYANSLKGKKEYAVLSLADPLPFLMEYLMIPYLWWRRGF